MKILKLATLLAIGLMATAFSYKSLNRPVQKASQLIGAWETTSDGKTGLWIITEKHFSATFYKSDEFLYTEGGEWKFAPDGIELMWEYNTQDEAAVGTEKVYPISIKGNKLTMEKTEWKRVDNGSPGKLSGAWLITGLFRDGEMSERTPGARRTMKILSGTKFQWIAYNVETKEFFGTGGGSYTTKDGKYTENIEFFSRDNSRVGASLQFDFKIENGKWRHSGKSSKGDPLDEVWTKRDVLGI
ncbi:MAG: membrane or secreted protein [Cyclobacteriaceae bacterium]